jgi:hypothetical protein
MFHVQLLSSLFVIYYVFLDSPILYSIKRLGYAIILSLVPCCHGSANRSHGKSNRMGNGRSIM